jgi:succinate-acetate transporter protein
MSEWGIAQWPVFLLAIVFILIGIQHIIASVHYKKVDYIIGINRSYSHFKVTLGMQRNVPREEMNKMARNSLRMGIFWIMFGIFILLLFPYTF